MHDRHADAFLVLNGELQITIGRRRETIHAPAGTFALIPPGVSHSFVSPSDSTAEFLNFHAPGEGFIDYLRGHDHEFDQHAPPANDSSRATDAIVRPLHHGN